MPDYKIALTPEEKRLVDTIQLDITKVDYAIVQKNGDAILALLKLLSKRNAIPAVRLKFWTDPNYQIGRLKASHKGLFERNGCTGEDIYRHPHFLPYLNYFLFGADLPASLITEFVAKVGNPKWVTSGDVVPIGTCARHLTKRYGLNKTHAAGEFFKLALDVGLDLYVAQSVYRSVMQLR